MRTCACKPLSGILDRSHRSCVSATLRQDNFVWRESASVGKWRPCHPRNLFEASLVRNMSVCTPCLHMLLATSTGLSLHCSQILERAHNLFEHATSTRQWNPSSFQQAHKRAHTSSNLPLAPAISFGSDSFHEDGTCRLDTPDQSVPGPKH